MQRFKCLRCSKTFAEAQILDHLRVETAKAEQVVALLTEGCGIRAVSRLTNLHQGTVLNILAVVGEKCLRFMDEKIRDVEVESVQCDELFTFVHCKESHNHLNDPERGTQFTYLGVDRKSKFILSHLIGKRCAPNTELFVRDLRKRVKGHPQVTTDGLQSYIRAFYREFSWHVDFAQQIKEFATKAESHEDHRYSPTRCVGVRNLIHTGHPDPRRITTSHVERMNLSVRHFSRRFTRLTIGFSKTLQNLRFAVALFIMHFNFCRVHGAHKSTPAQAIGLADRTWTVAELLKNLN